MMVVLFAWLPGGSSAATGGSIVLDKVIKWEHPLALTPQEFEGAFAPRPDGTPAVTKRTVGAKPPSNAVTIQMTMSGAESEIRNLLWDDLKFEIRAITAVFTLEQQCQRITISLVAGEDGKGVQQAALAQLARVFKGPPASDNIYKTTSGNSVSVQSWMSQNGSCLTTLTYPADSKYVFLSVQVSFGSQVAPGQSPTGVAESRLGPAAADAELDALLSFGDLWKWTADEFEKHYNTAAKDDKHIQFEWLNAAKDRARFSRKLVPPKEGKLTMFSGTVKVEEAIVEFVKGRAARATVSFYNRGDSGDIATTEFERIYKKVGQNLTDLLKVKPRSQLNSSNAALKTTGWNWTTPAGIALLEYNDYTVRDPSGATSKPEFLRLKLAAPDQADWSMGKLTVGVQRMALTKNVTKTPDGDVYIAGVPMVDQGAKGYCVAASCQRLFEYMRIPCDQHEMAKLISADSDSGASVMVMQKSLAKVDSAFQVSFKPLVNPLNYYDSRRNRRVSLKEFVSIIKDHVDKGVPLLWGLELGRFQEIPPLPNGGQVSGGHMRLVIGYNAAKNQVLFTDSWGAGHELKRTAAMDAYEETLGLYSMSPRGM